MAKSFAVKNSHVAVLITVLIAIFLGACYFFIYIPDNEKTVQERYFRCLQNVDENIDAKIQNSVAQLTVLLDAEKRREPDFQNYIDNYHSDYFAFVPEDKVPAKYSAEGTYIDVDQAGQFFSIYMVQTDNANSRKLGITYKLNEFINPLLPKGCFEKYIIFNDADKSIITESFTSGLGYEKTDSLLQLRSGIVSPGVRTISIGGKDYKAFSHAVTVPSKIKWIVVGLVDEKNYQHEKSQLPLVISQLLLTIGIGIVIMFPWIKLFHMGNKDKLTVTDGVASVLIGMVLMSLLVLIVFKYSFYFMNRSGADPKKQQDTIPTQIIAAYSKDLKTADSLLTTYDGLQTDLTHNIINLGKKNVASPGTTLTDHQLKVLDSMGAKNIDVKQVYWLSLSGMEACNWTAAQINAPHTNFGTRNYFIKTAQNKFNWSGGDNFYVDQLISRTSNEFTSVIAKKTVHDGAIVVGMSFTAKSLDSVVMPDGYQFAIIDSTGKVCYDSNPDRNLNENLVDEFADSTKLVGAIASKSDIGFNALYYGKEYSVRIKPFNRLPYFVVVFENNDYSDARDTESYSFTITMLVSLLLFLVIQAAVVFFASSKRSVFKKQHFETSWIGPKITMHHQYNMAVIANLGIIALLTIVFYWASFLNYLYMLLFSITAVSLYLNIIFYDKYTLEDKQDYRYYKKIAILWLCIFVLLIDWAAFFTLAVNSWLVLLGFEIVVTAFGLAMRTASDTLLKKLRQFKEKKRDMKLYWTYTHSYALMTTTKLIITSGIPIGFFFIYSFNYEQNLDARYRQFNFAQAISKKITRSDFAAPAKKGTKNYLPAKTAVYYDGDAVKEIQIKDTGRIVPLNNEQQITGWLLNAPRPLNNDLEIRSNNMNGDSVGQTAFFGNSFHHKSSFMDKSTTFYKVDGHFIRIKSGDIKYPTLTWGFWLLLCVLLVVFYYIILGVIRKLFALNLPAMEGWDEMNSELLYNSKLNSFLFVLGSPGSAKLKMITNKLKTNKYTPAQENELQALREADDSKALKAKLKEFGSGKLTGPDNELLVFSKDPLTNNVFIADMILISSVNGEDDPDWKKCKTDALRESNSLVIINHFEYNIKDPVANAIKLNFLETLLQRAGCKVMIISTVHPITFLDSFMDEQANSGSAEKVTVIPESELDRWQVLLGHFRIIIQRLSDIRDGDDAADLKTGTQLERAIFEETQYSHYLNNMYRMSMNKANRALAKHEENTDAISDSVIFKLQITSHYFYTYIWQSLTKEEKFLLYDLAEDGLVNPFDDYNLSMLISKGLIIKPDGTLRLFNKGFRNFILTSIGASEVNRIKAQVKDNGNWSSLKVPLIIALLAIAGFLIASEQEAYSKIITYVTAIGAGIPAVLKIFSLFPGGGGTQKTQ